MKSKRKIWVWMPSKPSTVPDHIKTKVSAKANTLILSQLKPTHIKPAPKETNLNYLVDISTKWHGRFFTFISKYACPGENAISPFFETPFARMEYQNNGRFGLAYMRHTGQWWPVYSDLTFSNAMTIIAEDPLFTP